MELNIEYKTKYLKLKKKYKKKKIQLGGGAPVPESEPAPTPAPVPASVPVSAIVPTAATVSVPESKSLNIFNYTYSDGRKVTITFKDYSLRDIIPFSSNFNRAEFIETYLNVDNEEFNSTTINEIKSYLFSYHQEEFKKNSIQLNNIIYHYQAKSGVIKKIEHDDTTLESLFKDTKNNNLILFVEFVFPERQQIPDRMATSPFS